MHRHLRGALATLMLALLLPSAADAASPGVNLINDLPDVQRAVDTGAQEIRLFADWAAFEPAGPGQINDNAPGPAVNLRDSTFSAIQTVKKAGRRVMVVITGAPPWANGGQPETTPPTPGHYGDFANFVAAFLKRASDQGAPVDEVEIWNEPDGGEYWKPGPDPAGYAALLKAAYAAAKDPAQGDPRAAVFAGPTAGNNYAWIQQLYDNGAKGSFDGVSVHTDTACLTAAPDSFYRDPATGRLGQFTFLGYREVRATMLANGDDKPIAMSELGWSSTGGTAGSCTRGSFAGQKPDGVDAATQAQYLTAAFTCLANDPYVTIANWFQLKDTTSSPLNEFNHYGLFDASLGAKPALSAFRGVLPGGGAAGPCGDFTPPTIRVLHPVPNEQFVDKLDVQAAATDTGVGLGRISFFVDGGSQEIRNFTSGLANDTPVGLTPWQNSSKLTLGAHTIRIVAVDTNGNQATQDIPVVKVVEGAVKSTLTPKFKLGKKAVRCKRRVCVFRGSLLKGVPGTPSLNGKIAVEWQWRNKKGRWRKLVGGLKPANKPFTFRAKLKKSGRWRVRAVYQGKAPWKKTQTIYLTFRVK